MCLSERHTLSRSRPVSPWRRLLRRLRNVRRSRVVVGCFIQYPFCASACRCLAGLEPDGLARVTDALAVVAVRFTGGTDVGGHLADHVLVDAGDGDLRRFGSFDRDAFRRLDRHLMRVTELQFELLAFHRSAETYTVDLQVLRVTVCHSDNGVVDQSAGQSVLGPVITVVARPADGERAVFELHLHPFGDDDVELAFRSFDLYQSGLDVKFDVAGNGDGIESDA